MPRCRHAPEVTAEELDAFDDLREKFADDPVFKAGAIKLMADGVVESHTAAMLEPYSNRPAVRGEPRMSADDAQSSWSQSSTNAAGRS